MPPENRLDDLTAREREVLDLVRLGLTNEEIAGRLGITEAGAKYHVSQILSKLGVATREEAAAVVLGARRRLWAALPLAAKAAGVAVVLAAVAGLGLLAWGLLRTTGGTEADVAAPGPQTPVATAVLAATPQATPGPAHTIPPCLAWGTAGYRTVKVEPDTVAVAGSVIIQGAGFAPASVSRAGYQAVLAPVYGARPGPCPPIAWPAPIPGPEGFPEHPRSIRGNGCELARGMADTSGHFELTVKIPETCTTLNGDQARILPGTYMIWDTTTIDPRPATWLTVTDSNDRPSPTP